MRAPNRFRSTTAAAVMRLSIGERQQRLAALWRHNAYALLAALRFCQQHGIGSFRINSQILPLKTHPELAYDLDRLPSGPDIIQQFRDCGEFARLHGLRLTFHPDPFAVLNSPRTEVVKHSIRELECHTQVAAWGWVLM